MPALSSSGAIVSSGDVIDVHSMNEDEMQAYLRRSHAATCWTSRRMALGAG